MGGNLPERAAEGFGASSVGAAESDAGSDCPSSGFLGSAAWSDILAAVFLFWS